MAGRESRAGNPLIRDFILLGQELAKLGFICSKGDVSQEEYVFQKSS